MNNRLTSLACTTLFSIFAVWGLNARAAETVAHYVVSEKPTSLADGKVTLRYDATGAVSLLRSLPGSGETIVIKGDGLVFSDGAQILVSQDGETRLPGSFTAAGSLTLGMTDLSWNADALLPQDSYQILFPDLHLDDVMPVSGKIRMKSGASIVDADAKAYQIRRADNTLTVQFQLTSGTTFTQAVLVELKQIDGNVCGKILKACYVKTGSWALGYDLFYAPAITTTHYDVFSTEYAPAYGYGLSQLTVSRRRDTYDFSEKFLSDHDDTIVTSNVAVEQLEFLYAACGHNKALRDISQSALHPYHVKLRNGVLSAQFQKSEDGLLKCVKVELRQSGADVVARIGYAKQQADGLLGTDFDNPGTGIPCTVLTEETYSADAPGFSVDMLALRRKTRGRIIFPVSGTTPFTTELNGAGSNLQFEPAENQTGKAILEYTAENKMTDASFSIKGRADCALEFHVNHKNALPAGNTDVYEYADLWLNRTASADFDHGISSGHSETTLYPGSRLYHNGANVIGCRNWPLTLDGAELRGKYMVPYLNNLTLKNGACLCRDSVTYVNAGHVTDVGRWLVTGTSASTNNLDLHVYAWGNGANGKSQTLTIDVEEITGDDQADFVMNGNVSIPDAYCNAGLIKAGAGTMLMNGTLSPSISGVPTRIAAGTLSLGANNVLSDANAILLEGGILATTPGTHNTVGSLTTSSTSGIQMAKNASLTLTTLSLAANATLNISSPQANSGLIVRAALDDDALTHITLNGHPVFQRPDGTLIENRGLTVLFR